MRGSDGIGAIKQPARAIPDRAFRYTLSERYLPPQRQARAIYAIERMSAPAALRLVRAEHADDISRRLRAQQSQKPDGYLRAEEKDVSEARGKVPAAPHYYVEIRMCGEKSVSQKHDVYSSCDDKSKLTVLL